MQNKASFENDSFTKTEQATTKEKGLTLCGADVYKDLPRKLTSNLLYNVPASQAMKQDHLVG